MYVDYTQDSEESYTEKGEKSKHASTGIHPTAMEQGDEQARRFGLLLSGIVFGTKKRPRGRDYSDQEKRCHSYPREQLTGCR